MNQFNPQPGEIYSFATTPATEFSPAQTGRYGALKVIGVKDGDRVFATLAGIWNEPPTFEQAAQCDILVKSITSLHGERLAKTLGWVFRLAVTKVTDDRLESETLSSPVLLGTQACTENEQELVHKVTSWSPLRFVAHAAEREWRWTNDHAAYAAEVELQRARDEERWEARERRIRERLSKLTFEKLLSETPLSKWSGTTSYPPAEFSETARKRMHDACRELKALGPKPRKAEVRKVLKETVEWFNEADKAAGGVIETGEAYDIYSALEELAYAAKQKGLIQEIDDWREW